MRAAVSVVVLVLVLAPAVALHASARAEPLQSLVIDETVACAVPIVRGGLREIEVNARSGTRLLGDPRKWRSLAGAGMSVPITNGGSVGLSAGAPVEVDPAIVDENIRLSIHVACRPTRAHVPFTRSGLAGGRAGQLGDEYDCVVPQRVLVRVRARFRTPTRLQLHRRSGFGLTVTRRVAKGTIRSGELAVRTPDAKPIAYADVHESGRARLFVSNRCVPD